MKENNFTQAIWNFLKSLKLTTTIIILIIATSMIGTVVAQRLQTNTPIEEIYGPLVIQIFGFFNLFDLYHSWWFNTLLVIFFINLIVCTVDRFPKILDLFNTDFSILSLAKLKSSPLSEALPFKDTNAVLAAIKKKYPAFAHIAQNEYPEEERFYYGKGRASCFNFLIVHCGLFVIIIGAVIGGMFGFDAQMALREGETSSTIQITNSSGTSTILPLGFAVTCNAFRIEYYGNTGRPKQYYSDLEIFERGKSVHKETIYVNHPLEHKSINLYQSSYSNNPSLVFTVKNNDKSTLVNASLQEEAQVQEFDLTLLPVSYHDAAESMGDKFGEAAVMVHVQSGGETLPPIWLAKNTTHTLNTPKGELSLSFNGLNNNFYTILQVSKNPGIKIICAGFFILCLGLFFVAFYSHNRYYLIVDKSSKLLHVIFIKEKFPLALASLFQKTLKSLQENIR